MSNKTIKTGMILCAVILAAAVLFTFTDLFKGNLFGYANAENYQAGNAEIAETVRNLDINWVNGKVQLEYGSGSAVVLKETSNKEIGADLQMRWWLDGDTLRVQYAKSGLNLSWNQEKNLTVTLPEGTEFGSVSIAASSADLEIPALKAENVSLATTSGDIIAAAEADQLSFGATSGDMKLNLTGSASSVTAGSTSGAISLTLGQAETVKATSTSGDIQVKADRIGTCETGSTSGCVNADIGDADQVKIGSTSGDVDVRLLKFAGLKVECTSGSISAALPAEPGFTAKVETTSGDFENELALKREGGKYVCGDGSGTVDLGTTSGDVLIEAAEE